MPESNAIRIKTDVEYVLISICTYKRPVMLKNALMSVNELCIPDNIKTELLVVDNDSEQSARTAFEELVSSLKIKSYYVVQEKRGISNARNKVLEEAIKIGASHILFYDDDELLEKNCLVEHIKLYNSNSEAVIISGPTISVFDESYPRYIKNHLVYKQRTTKKTGLVRQECACGNVFFPVSLIKDFGLRFSEEYVFMGGEDGDFFNKASKLGFTIVWNNEGIIYEVVPPARATISYVMKKCYYNGYAGTIRKFKNYKKSRIVYVIKEYLTLFANIILVLPSILLGLTGFFNVLGVCFRTKGKIDAAIKQSSYNFYQNVYGE